LPAATAGGPAYEKAILWGQTAGRVEHSFAHRRPFWWYLPLLPVLLFPLSCWLPAWRSLALWKRPAEPGLRFGLIVSLIGLVVFSLISGKQPHYLLPLAPALMLVVARSLAIEPDAILRRRDSVLVFVGFALLAIAVASFSTILGLMPRLAEKVDLPDWLFDTDIEIAALLFLAGAVSFWLAGRRRFDAALASVAVPGLMLFLVVHLLGFTPGRSTFDLEPAARVLKQAEDQGRPIAYDGDYAGEYQFLGRLTKPLELIGDADIPGWFAAHPNGLVVRRYQSEELDSAPKPVYAQQKRGRIMVIWDAAAFASNPGFFARQH
jgi:4-amino-4-deoxy-L-arabinose transferase-like glycosyltransferase